MVKVKLLSRLSFADGSTHDAGAVVEVEDAQAASLIEAALAVAVGPDAPPKARSRG